MSQAKKGFEMKILRAVSSGEMSILEAARELRLQDAGFVLGLMREANLELPRLPEEVVRELAFKARKALKDSLIVDILPSLDLRRRQSRKGRGFLLSYAAKRRGPSEG